MAKKVSRICFVDDDVDDLLIFSSALDVVFPQISLTSFFACKDLLTYLGDDDNPLPDLIFLDFNMPVENGNECLIKIKKSPKLSHIPVIIYSTSSKPAEIKESYRNGAHKYIVKPSSFEAVKSAIRETVSEYQHDTSVHKSSLSGK